MLYIISGVPRSGKSNLARKLLEEYKISGVSGDMLLDSLILGYPQLGLKEDMRDRDRTPILWPFFKGFIEQFQYYKSDYVLESTNFNPDSFDKLDYNYIKVCFLGYKDIDTKTKLEQIRNNHSDAEWTNDISDTQLIEWIDSWKRRSLVLEEECSKYGLKYYDTSLNFTDTINRIAKELVVK